MVETTQPHVERARDLVDEEMRRVEAEREAFESFRARLRRMDGPRRPSTLAVADGAGTTALGVAATSPDGRLDAVRSAYRETVMSVPHYERDYDDSLAANLAAEFGTDVAGMVAREHRLTPPLYDALLEGAETAGADRERFLAALRGERESLTRVRAELDEYESRAVQCGRRLDATDGNAAPAVAEDLSSLASSCRDLARRRQETIHDRSVGALSGVGGESLTTYLYEGTGTTCPALTDALACLDTIRHVRDRCRR